MNDKIRLLTIGITLILSCFPQVSAAEEFTGTDLLTWSEDGQNNYFQTSVTMAAFVAAQFPTEQAKCINDWYYDDITGKNDFLRDVVADYPDFHPSATILAAIEKNCGKFSQ